MRRAALLLAATGLLALAGLVRAQDPPSEEDPSAGATTPSGSREAPAVAAEAPSRGERSSGSANALEDVEGTVVALDTETAEGDLPVVTLDLRTEEGERRVALAPESVLSEAGFEVAEGDRVRARVFVGDGEGAAPAQKVMNLSRNLLLRLRTFSRAPIWDAHGQWEGSPTRGDERTRRHRPTRRPQPPPTRPPPPPPTRPPPGP